MKKALLIVSIFVSSFSSFSADYFWNPDGINGNILWSDLNNWYTTSGGTIHPAVLPGPGDDVYFDSNTLWPAMWIDMNAQCKTVFFNGPFVFSPEVNIEFSYSLEVYGSFYGVDDLMFNGLIKFKATTTGNVIDLYMPLAANPALYVLSILFNGSGGEWTLSDDLDAYTIGVVEGTLNTNSKTINTSTIGISGPGAKTLNLGASEINLYDEGWISFAGAVYSVNAGTSTIWLRSGGPYIAMDAGYGHHFHRIVIDTLAPAPILLGVSCEIDELIAYGLLNGTDFTGTIHRAEFYNASSVLAYQPSNAFYNFEYDTLILENTLGNFGYMYDIDTLFVNDVFQVNTGPGDTIAISGLGSQALRLPNDTICIDYVKLDNSNAIGNGYYFAGNNSVDLGSNTGWVFTNCQFPADVSGNEEKGLNIFPNPATDNFQILNASSGYFEVFDTSGNIVVSDVIDKQKQVSTEHLGSGLYFIKVYQAEKVYSGKIMLIK
ncbi:MAG: T9SS type A sorting domain-containing protein [Bacteroidota bacterium]